MSSQGWIGGAMSLGLLCGVIYQQPQSQPIPSSPVLAVATPRSTYTQQQIDYFLEVAMGSEFGESTSTIRKWQGLIKIKVHGSPTPQDLQALQQTINDIEVLTNAVQIQIVSDSANIDLYFVPENQFSQYEPNYRPLNYGFFWTYWNQQQIIERATILISTVGVSQSERSHLIREELTQALGLMQDSNRYPDSIFYQGWTDTSNYSPLDQSVIQMLHDSRINPGMTRSEVQQVFSPS